VENGTERDVADDEIFGTVAVQLAAVPAADFARATELMRQALDGVLADLDRALRIGYVNERQRASSPTGPPPPA
jgi:hypothetical protein